MRDVKNILIISILLITIGCSSSKNEVTNTYKIKVYKVKTGTYITFQSFHYEEFYNQNKIERCPSTYWVNNLIFTNHGLNDLTLLSLKGKVKIDAGEVNKELISLKDFDIKTNDSIVIKFYLKDNLGSLHDDGPDIITSKKQKY